MIRHAFDTGHRANGLDDHMLGSTGGHRSTEYDRAIVDFRRHMKDVDAGFRRYRRLDLHG